MDAAMDGKQIQVQHYGDKDVPPFTQSVAEIQHAYELGLVLTGTERHAGGCSCHTVSEIED
jgi:hypothetical protein